MNDNTLHMSCSKCKHYDIVLKQNAKEWKCPFCELAMMHNTEITEIDFQSTYGDVVGRIICKDCKSGEHIISKVDVDVTGYARIWVYCDKHGEWEPTGALTR